MRYKMKQKKRKKIYRIIYKILKAISNCTYRTKNIMFTFSTVILLFCIMMILQSFGKTKHAEAAATVQKNTQSNYEYSPSSGSEDEEDWALILVNPWHSLPENYEVSLLQLNDEQSVDERCYHDLQQMMDDCRAAGLSPMICSSYRTVEKQEQLYNEKINELVAQGYSQEDAANEAGQTVAIPGTSEHHLGLALDLVDENHQVLDSSQEETPVQQWLMENSWKYGFILRYPSGKSDITGIIYEPWHYRYVGKTAAAEIYEKDICLEEYLGQAEHN